ncbi:MAG: hypothetical protein ABIT96_11460 [Ferruginibacter sp.]
MKKIFTLISASLFALVLTASAAQPQVTITTYGNYEVAIDGRNFSGQNTYIVNDLALGTHNVSIYQVVSNGILGIGKKRNQVSNQQFRLQNSDVTINVDQNGRARISQYGNNGGYNNTNDGRYDRRDHDGDHRDGDYNKNNKNEKGRYGRSEGKGNGHKYGHYKNKKGNRQDNNRRDN